MSSARASDGLILRLLPVLPHSQRCASFPLLDPTSVALKLTSRSLVYRHGNRDPTRSERPSLLPSRPATDTSTPLLPCVITFSSPSLHLVPPNSIPPPLQLADTSSCFTPLQYGNEAEVGQGIVDSGVPRSEIWLTTKLNNPDHKRVAEALEDSLKNLGTDYVDLYLMHWPCSSDPADKEVKTAYKDWNFVDTWKELEKIPESKARNIGISNFDIVNLEKLLPTAKRLPAVNQIELHPNMPTPKLVQYCKDKGIQCVHPLPSIRRDHQLTPSHSLLQLHRLLVPWIDQLAPRVGRNDRQDRKGPQHVDPGRPARLGSLAGHVRHPQVCHSLPN